MDKQFLEQVLQTISVSGCEDNLSRVYLDYLQKYVDAGDIDIMGNACATIQNDSRRQTVMIEAHSDEIGFQVLHIGDSGYIYVRRNGGIDEQCMPGSQVVIQTSTGELIPGVIGKKPIHLMNTDDRKRTIDLYQLWVDTGLDIDQVRAKIFIGDYVALQPNFMYLGENKITSKALDNKLGVFILSQVMKRLSQDKSQSFNIYGVATVQEEVGSRGSIVSAFRIKPDISITIDMDFATDVPDCSPSRYGKISLGAGVIIPRNVDCCPILSREIERIAKENDISHQISARPHATGGTNTSRIQLSREGVRTISMGIPCRYMHTPVELCDLRDVESAIELIILFCKQS